MENMPASSRLSKEKSLASRLRELMPSKVADGVEKNLSSAKISRQAKRAMLYDMSAKERELILFPLRELEAAGVDVPKMGKDAIFLSTGPGNGELVNKGRESVAFRFRGSEIICSVRGSAPIRLGLKRGKRVVEHMQG
jgi:carbamoylphosphate synthase small subunit